MAPEHRHHLTVTAVSRGLVLAVVAVIMLAVPGVAHADQIRDRQWHLGFLDIERAHQITRGEGVTVAVLDSGVDYRHPDLKGALLKGNTFAGGRDDGWEDAKGHGTGMASLIAARGHGPGNRDGVLGIAPGVRILPVRVTKDFGDSRGLEQGIEWAADHGADILSISLADFDVPGLQEATEYALGKGVVIVAGVGNTENGDTEVMAPARYPGVVASSGVDQDGNFTDASVSGPQVVLSAPATDVMSADLEQGYDAGTGTSNSTAIVAGVAALIKSKYPDLDAANVIQRLIATADDRGPDGRDSQYGFGVVDPVAALTEDVPKVDANPLLASSKPPARSPSTTHAAGGTGISPVGYGVIGLGVLGAVALTTAGFVALTRRRRTTPHHTSAARPEQTSPAALAPGQLRPPAPPPPDRPPPWQ